jgi:phosphoribosyl 1,2-cyclic phosphodiesterase
MLEVHPLASGSQGNATLIRSASTSILVDAGLSRKEMLARLSAVDQKPEELGALLLTHRHKDHCLSAATLCRRLRIPLYATPRTAEHQQPRTLPKIHEIQPGGSFEIGDIQIHALTLPHDAPETQAFVFESLADRQRIGIATDLGCSQGGVVQFLQDLDVLLLEFNHDSALLRDGPYPAFLKERIASPVGHLSNEQSLEILELIAGARLQALYLCHLSQHNNDATLALEAAQATLARLPIPETRIQVALQDSTTEGHRLG